MSLKTLRKRIALVAVSALAVTGLSIVPANAAVGFSWTNTLSSSTSGASNQNASATAIVGKYVSIEITTEGDEEEYRLEFTGAGGPVGGFQTAAVGFTADNGLDEVVGDGLLEVTGDGDVVKFRVRSTSAGTSTIKLITQTAGTTSLNTTITISWVTAASAEIDKDKTIVYLDNGACEYGSGDSPTKAQALAALDADAITSIAADEDIYACVIAYDGNGELVADFDYTAFTTIGGSDTDTAMDSAASIQLTPTATPAKVTVTVVLTAGDTTITKTASIDVYGSWKTLALGNLTYAAAADGATSDADTASVLYSYAGLAGEDDTEAAIGTAGSSDGGLVLVAKDSNGIVADLSGSEGDFDITVDSDKVPGTPTAGNSDAYATVSFAAATTSADDLGEMGGNGVLVECGEPAEKLTITLFAYTSAGVLVTTNPATFYCAGASDKVEVTVAAQAVNVKVTDKNGYPVADGTEVTLVASNGSVVTPTSKTTVNGAFAKTATFIPTSSAASSNVVALAGTKSGTSAAIAGTGTTDATLAALIAAVAKLQKAIAKINKRLKK